MKKGNVLFAALLHPPPQKNNRGIQKQDCIFPTDGGFKDGMGKLKVNIRD